MENLPIKDKIAVVFHGIVGGMDGRNGIGESSNIENCAKTIKHNILEHYDNDVFLHSWSINHKDELEELYTPIYSLYQEQEYFNFSKSQITDHDKIGQSYRTVSRYTSLERAMRLKQKYEIENGFRYKWVLALRFDLVFFNKIDLSKYDNNFFHICSEPHWVNLKRKGVYHDIIFLSNSTLMDEYGKISIDIKNGKYDSSRAHSVIYLKLMDMFNNNGNMVKESFKRYDDIEIYRLIMKPELNEVGHQYGALKTKNRLEELLKKIK